jgi:hypothetical protein
VRKKFWGQNPRTALSGVRPRALDTRRNARKCTDSVVSCLIPGHDRAGREVVAEVVAADDEYFHFAYEGTCGFEASFHYTSD